MTKWNRILIGAGLIAATAAGCGDEGDDDDDHGGSSTGSYTSTGGYTSTGSATSTGGYPASGGRTSSGGAGLGGNDQLGGAAGEGMGGAPPPGRGTGRLISGRCYPACEDADSDEDGNGWGWEDDGSCIVVDSPLYDQGEPCGEVPSVECADGCAVLSAPLTAAGQNALWQIELDDADLSAETLTFRVYIQAGTRGTFRYGFQNAADLGVDRQLNLNATVGTWLELSIDMAEYAPSGEGGAPNPPVPDSSHVAFLNVGIESGTGTGSRANPTVVYVDLVHSSGGTIDYGFVSNANVLTADAANLAGSTATHTIYDP